MDDNNYFSAYADAVANQKNQRIKGYYICPLCGEFLKAIARKRSHCPFCHQMVDRILTVDSLKEQMIFAVWQDAGIYSDIRADKYIVM